MPPVATNTVEIMSADFAEISSKVCRLCTAKSVDTVQIKIRTHPRRRRNRFERLTFLYILLADDSSQQICGNGKLHRSSLIFGLKRLPFLFQIPTVCLLVKMACKMSGAAKSAEIVCKIHGDCNIHPICGNTS